MITAIKDILTDATITFTKDGLKIIDFDVGLFNIIPDKLNPIPEKYTKILNPFFI